MAGESRNKEISLEKCEKLARSIEESLYPKVGLKTQLLGFTPEVFENEYFVRLVDFESYDANSSFMGGEVPTLVIPYRRGVQLIVHSTLPLFYTKSNEPSNKLSKKLNRVHVRLAHEETPGCFFIPEKEDVLYITRGVAEGKYDSAIQKMIEIVEEILSCS